jgi:hypothetical protein
VNNYEIRLHSRKNASPEIHHLMQFSDFAAIRKAVKLAAGQKLEVWRNSDCIYVDERPQAS